MNKGGRLSRSSDKHPERAAIKASSLEERRSWSHFGRRGTLVAGHLVSCVDFLALASPERLKTFSALLLGST